MVSRSEDDSLSPGQTSSFLPPASQKIHEVIVPVFLKVSLLADDELHAECLALETLRRHFQPQQAGGASVHFQSLLSPIVKKNPAVH